jgi:hypothetical protein
MLKGNAKTSLLVLCLSLIVSCQKNSSGNGPIDPTQIAPVVTATSEKEAPSITPGPTWTPPPIEASSTPGSSGGEGEAVDWILSEAAVNFIGEVVAVHVDVSHCAYKPGVNGAPTFCNDQPFPNHTFTYLMWGVDLSRFDQQCVLVIGQIVEYDGKPQIVIENEDQILPCDP